MAGSKVNTYGSTNTSLTNIQTVLDGTRLGFSAISLTDFSSGITPEISAGSEIEIAGALYKFSTAEPISTTSVTATNTAWYFELVPSSSIVTARFSTSTPIWRSDYNGYYISTSSINRIFGGVYVYNSTGYLQATTINHKNFRNWDNYGWLLKGASQTYRNPGLDILHIYATILSSDGSVFIKVDPTSPPVTIASINNSFTSAAGVSHPGTVSFAVPPFFFYSIGISTSAAVTSQNWNEIN